MNAKWIFFTIVIVAAVALVALPTGQQQAIAQYIFLCLIAAVVIKPLGLSVGKLIRWIMYRD